MGVSFWVGFKGNQKKHGHLWLFVFRSSLPGPWAEVGIAQDLSALLRLQLQHRLDPGLVPGREVLRQVGRGDAYGSSHRVLKTHHYDHYSWILARCTKDKLT